MVESGWRNHFSNSRIVLCTAVVLHNTHDSSANKKIRMPRTLKSLIDLELITIAPRTCVRNGIILDYWTALRTCVLLLYVTVRKTPYCAFHVYSWNSVHFKRKKIRYFKWKHNNWRVDKKKNTYLGNVLTYTYIKNIYVCCWINI